MTNNMPNPASAFKNSMNKEPRVALVHFWLLGMRGGEKVLEALCRMFPQADIFTHVYNPDAISETIKKHKIHTTFINRLPKARKLYQTYLPLMPLALDQLDLTGYDLVISSESGPAKGIVTSPDAAHICYCHSPMRYIWDLYHEYTAGMSLPKRILAAPIMHYMRIWDRTSAIDPDMVIANSSFIARRVKKCWGRDAEVVHPPVAVDNFSPLPKDQKKNFYLCFGELVPYKRADLAVKAFSRPGCERELIVIGQGEQLDYLKKIAGPKVTFLGRQPDGAVKQYLANCRALVFPGLEDFGIIPVEALASGTPVIAYGRGGVKDTVEDGQNGIFFYNQTEEDLLAAIERFEEQEDSFDPARLALEAKRFTEENFTAEMRKLVDKVLTAKGLI